MASTVYYPPNPPLDMDGPSVFLAGTIDMGNSFDWQSEIGDILGEKLDRVCILNPRRKAWDSSWKQDISEPNFRGQVEWELDWQDEADLIVMYFAPTSQSPITLLELGLAAAAYPEKVLVCCPEGYWRRGNVQIVCERFDIPLLETIDELVDVSCEFLKKKLP